MSNQIQTFTGGYICFYRRNKRTYYILGWSADVRKWVRVLPEFTNLALHRSRVSRDGIVNINIATSSGASQNRISVTADGYYLKSSTDCCIPILKTRRSLPAGFMLRDYTALDLPCVETDYALWTLRPSTQVNEMRGNLTSTIEKIPTRIAWIIAEDASKKGEACPISTNDISPITSSVTSCYHVFETASINDWVKMNPVNTPCPVCRTPCKVTEAYLLGETN
jgi:hypothetical protein